MQPNVAPPGVDASSSASAEQSLADLLEQITRRLDADEVVDVDELARDYPRYAERLRELMPTMLGMAHWGRAPVSRRDNGAPARDGLPTAGVLGDFRILRELGRGGMGTVYEAEQLAMGRRVALKVLPFAALAHDKALQRFRNEVRAAAALDHPHIVSVYSVGEERGIHYYAMQLIRGQTLAEMIHAQRGSAPPPLQGGARGGTPDALLRAPVPSPQDPAASRIPPPTPPCEGGGTASGEAATIDWASAAPASTVRDAQARLSTAVDSRHDAERYRAAARLGVQAAGALQHAHDQGVLHRDVKPGNLLVDADGNLYVADFGLARIEADAGMTMTGDLIGTLRYMAPEQALAKRVVIDHRADVYSLGATLYELLTLQPAFGETDRSELLKQIAFHEPTPLRKLDRRIPVELETIVLKAMAKNPDERYETAQQVGDDLSAFLEHRPIAARPPTLLDRATKWSRRHVAAVWATTCGTALLAVVLGVGAMLLAQSRDAAFENWRIAQDLKRDAEVQRDIAVKANNDAEEQRQAAEAQRHAAEEQRQAADAARQLAEARLKIARQAVDDMYTGVAEEWLGQEQDFAPLQRQFLQKALALYEEFAQENTDNLQFRLDAARAQLRIGTIYQNLGELAQSEQAFRKALSSVEELQSQFGESVEVLAQLSFTLHHLAALLYIWAGRPAEALPLLERALAVNEARLAADAESFKGRYNVAATYHGLGNVYSALRRFDEAEANYLRHFEILDALHQEAPENRGVALDRANALHDLARTHRHTDRSDEADEVFRRALEMVEELLAGSPQDKYIRKMLARQLLNFDGDGESERMQRAIEILRKLDEDFPGTPEYRLWIIGGQVNECRRLVGEGETREAEELAASLLPQCEQLVADFPVPMAENSLCRMLGFLGRSMDKNGKHAEAEAHFHRAIQGFQRLATDYPSEADFRRNLGATLQDNVDLLLNCPDAARRDPERALMLARQAAEVSPEDDDSWSCLSAAEYRNGHWEEAVQAGRKSTEIRGQGETVVTLIVAVSLARQGKMNEAEAWIAKVNSDIPDEVLQNEHDRQLFDEAKSLFGDEWVGSATAAVEPAGAPAGSSPTEIDKIVATPRRGPRGRDLQKLGNEYAIQGRYAEAAERYAILVQRNPDDDGIALYAAYLLLASGDRARYEALCRQMLERFGSNGSSGSAHRVSWICALSREPVGDMDQLLRLADLGTTDGNNPHLGARGHSLVSYRAGDWEGALQWSVRARELETPSRNPLGMPSDLLIEAMALYQLGKPAEAKASYDEAVTLAPDSNPNTGWLNWAYYQQLRREAEDLLQID